MTFRRRLGISSIGTCCTPQELTTDINILRFREFVTSFTVLARQILGCGRLLEGRIDELTDAMRALLETIPEALHFNEAWKDEGNASSQDIWSLRVMAAGALKFYILCLWFSHTEAELLMNSFF